MSSLDTNLRRLHWGLHLARVCVASACISILYTKQRTFFPLQTVVVGISFFFLIEDICDVMLWCFFSVLVSSFFLENQFQRANTYMLFAGWEVRMVKNCDRGLENTARGRRPRAAFSRPRSQFSPYGPTLRAVNTARSSINWTIFERVNGS